MEQTIGQKLKHIRESKGISLEEISKETRIRMKYLLAIEANDIEILPSPMQMRGFLRLYASFLGIEIESLIVEGYHLTEEAQQAEPSSQSPENLPSTQEPATPEAPDEQQNDEEVEKEEESAQRPQEDLEPTPESQPESQESFPPETPQTTLTSEDIFKQIGEKLQNRREMLSLSLDDVKSQLHIRKRYLQALEAGEFDTLTSSVQAKGMLANYADFLNLESDALLLNFAEGLQKQRLEKTKTSPGIRFSAKEVSNTRLKLKNFFSLDLLIITVIFISFAVFVIWGVNRILEANSPETESTALPEVADVLLATSSPTPQFSPSSDATGQTEAEETLPVTEDTPLFTPLPNDSPINVVVVPLQQAWVRVLSDAETVFEGRLLPGNAYDYFGEEKVEILTGNAGALQLYFNDQDLGSVGLMGQVANLIFTQNGLILPTPTHTPTFTETPQISPTPTMTPSPSPTLSETND